MLTYSPVDDAVKAIAAPRRREILTLIRDGELSAGEIAARFDVTRPAVSQHLSVLRDAGLVTERRDGTRRLYRARPQGLGPLRDFLEEFWDNRLGALAREAELEERKTMQTSETTAVERELSIAAHPETVWQFLVDPDRATRWMGVSATLDPRPGGVYRVEVLPGQTARGEFVELDPPRRLVFTWGWEAGSQSPVAAGSTTVEIELVPDGDGTNLRLRHHGLPDEAAAGSHAHGWEHYLERLGRAAAGDDPGRDAWLDDPMT
jgi:uncharacterized protein YndB with AHSA1/START domain/DNA-binding transcriptional ArsR family regulator